MINIKGIVGLIALTLSLGCSPFYKTKIINNSSSNIEVNVHFNRDIMQFISPKQEQQIESINGLFYDIDSNKMKFDSINFISKYELSVKDSLYFSIGMESGKKFLPFVKQMVIVKNNDSIIIQDYKTLSDLFTRPNKELVVFQLTDSLFKKNKENTPHNKLHKPKGGR